LFHNSGTQHTRNTVTLMIIAADSNIPFITYACAELGTVLRFDARDASGVRDAVAQADVVLCRSTLRVDDALLAGSAVRFVATATSGTEHIDIAALEARGVAVASAAGSNARSVAEWVMTALFHLALQQRRSPHDLRLGIVGVGHVGTAVLHLSRAVGMSALLNDPPRSERGDAPPPGAAGGWQPLEQLLAASDAITVHTPLQSEGPHRSAGLLNSGNLSRLARTPMLLNAARGEVVDMDAVRAFRGSLSAVALDVFPGEPEVDPDLLALADVVTPHVAGHSLDGKLLGTQMVYDALCAFLGVPPQWRHEQHLPEDALIEMQAGELRAATPEEQVAEVLLRACPLLRDDAALRAVGALPGVERARAFGTLRAEYPVRREFHRTRVYASGFDEQALAMLGALGFLL